MSKLTFFLLLALTTYVLNNAIDNLGYEKCPYIEIDGASGTGLINELEEDYCSALKTTGDYTHCCLFESENNIFDCYQITDDQYENIGRFKKYLRDQTGDDDIGIDCSSRFISFSLLAVLALLF